MPPLWRWGGNDRPGSGPTPTVLRSRPQAARTPAWPRAADAPFHMVHVEHPSKAAPRPCGGGRGMPQPGARSRCETRGEEVRGEIQRMGCWGSRLTFFGLCPSWPWSFSFGPGAQALQERGMDERRMWRKGGNQGEVGDLTGTPGRSAGPA